MRSNEVSSTTLTEAIERAELLVKAEDYAGAATILEAASQLLDNEQDMQIVLRYAESCNHWCSPEVEEAALRSALRLGASLKAVESLLFLLRGRVNTLEGRAHEAILIECEGLSTEAMRMLGQTSDLEWSNLVHIRGLGRLKLSSFGRQEYLSGARADFEAYRDWLTRNESAPTHLQRENLVALVDIELAELSLIEGRRADAMKRVKGAIAVLEAAKVPNGMVKHAYEVLERAGKE